MPSLVQHATERLYEISRDIYAPAITAFTITWLDELAEQPADHALCLGRDGLSPFLAARILLRMQPERFRPVQPKQVRLAYLSRALAVAAVTQPAQTALLERYLRLQGVDHARRLMLVDVGIHGSIQNALQQMYPARSLYGRYLILRRRSNDRHGASKHGFLAEVDVAPPLAVVVTPSRSPEIDVEVGGTLLHGDCIFLQRQSVHVLEDFWNGISEGAEAFRLNAPSTRVEAVRRRIDAVVALPPGSLLSPREHARLKRAALQGVVDGVAGVAAKGLSSFNEGTAIARLSSWLQALENPEPIDAYLFRVLLRHRNAVGGTGSGHDEG